MLLTEAPPGLGSTLFELWQGKLRCWGSDEDAKVDASRKPSPHWKVVAAPFSNPSSFPRE